MQAVLMNIWRRALGAAVLAATILLFAVAALYAFDRFLAGETGPNPKMTLELYPYEGFHNRADFHYQGTNANERFYQDFDWRFGKLGFFEEMDLRDPPAKPADEIRIVLIGGSGAMGQGARTNEDMFYRKLQTRLNEMLAAKNASYHVRVVNMAMGGSVTYQNFITLNRWGHRVDPDIILSYSGRNDIWVPFSNGDDGHYAFPSLAYLTAISEIAARPDDPWVLRFLAEHFPNLYTKTALPFLLKALFWGKRYEKIAEDRYRERIGQGTTPTNLEEAGRLGLPQQILGLQSIKRDFMGIPIVLAWQAMDKLESSTMNYNAMFDEVADHVRNYMNDDWVLINVHHMLESNPQPYISTHLGNEGHIIVANLLADQMLALVQKMAGRRGLSDSRVSGHI